MKICTTKYLVLILLPFLFLSCWNSSPTSDKDKSFTVGGSVTDKNGAGIKGISVKISGTNFSADDTTDSEGVFSFKGISSGTYNIKTTVENRIFKPSGIDVTVSDSNIDSLEFIAADNRIHGQTFDIITNKGIPNIKIFIHNAELEDSTITDLNGEYEFFDIPENDYKIDINDNVKYGKFYPIYYDVKTQEFSNSDIYVEKFYTSSEVLQIVDATYSKETNTVFLQWTPSKSNYCDSYLLMRTDKLSHGTGSADKYSTNQVFIEITPKYMSPLKNAKIIYYYVKAIYLLSRNPYFDVDAPYSEPVSIQVAE